MPTSVAHLFGGLAAAEGSSLRDRCSTARLVAFCAVVANLPDLDFLPGVLAGNAGEFHRVATHSLLAAFLVALVAGTIASRRGARFRPWFLLTFAVYASHLALDMLVTRAGSSAGVPLLWPLDRARWFTVVPLPGPLATLLDLEIDKTATGGFAAALFSWHAVVAFLGHALLFAPLPLLARLLRLGLRRAVAPLAGPRTTARRGLPRLRLPVRGGPEPEPLDAGSAD